LSKGHVSSAKVIEEICQENKAIIIQDVQVDHRVQYPKEAKEEGIKMMVDLPLFMGQNVVGILRIFFDEQRQFSEEELNFAVAIAEQCALAIDKARLIENNRFNTTTLRSRRTSSPVWAEWLRASLMRSTIPLQEFCSTAPTWSRKCLKQDRSRRGWKSSSTKRSGAGNHSGSSGVLKGEGTGKKPSRHQRGHQQSP